MEGRDDNARNKPFAEVITVELSELDAAISYARAWNRLDPEDFLTLLTEHSIYESQWVFDKLVGADAIGDYLRGKMRTVRVNSSTDPSVKVRAEIGIARDMGADRSCAYLQQGAHGVVLLFEVENGKIKRYDFCIPQLYRPDHSGVYPI